LYPYLNGDDINSRPDQSPSRWVINFFDWPVEVASEYRECFRVVEQKVKPERTRKNDENEYVLRKPLPQKWWIYADKRPGLYEAIRSLKRYLVHPLTSKYHNCVFYDSQIVCSHMTVVFALDDWNSYCILQSDLHWKWVLEYGNKLETRPQYNVTDCFNTFPFPAHNMDLASIGESYYLCRSQVTMSRAEGLTEINNRFHNTEEAAADIQKLRDLHVKMDNAVAAAYGWDNLKLGHDFHQTKQGLRFTISEPARREVLARLLKLNHERYAEEVSKGLHDKKKSKKAEKPKWQLNSDPEPQPKLF